MIPSISTSQLSDLVLTMARSGLALMLYGAPGIGKTSLLQGLGRHGDLLGWASHQAGYAIEELPVVTLSAPELNVEDLLGVPTVEDLVRHLPSGATKAFRVTRWALPALFDPTHPFILFIDEPNRCEPAVRNALFQLITGRTTTSGFELPKGSVVVMAGNRLEDKAGVRAFFTQTSPSGRPGWPDLAPSTAVNASPLIMRVSAAILVSSIPSSSARYEPLRSR